MESDRPEEQALQDYLSALWRRKWMILSVVLITTGVAYLATSLQHAEYRANAKVLLGQQDLVAAVTGTQDQNGAQPDRLVQTLSDLARVPIVAQRAISAAGVRNMTPTELLDSSSVTPTSDSDVINFSVRNADSAGAERLATAYAVAFRSYRHDLNTASLNRAQADVSRRLHALQQSNRSDTAIYGYLIGKSEELQTLQALQSSQEDVVQPAGDAVKIRPLPARNAVIGAVLGLLVGVALALLAEALDTRVWNVDEVRDRLGLPILAQVPDPRPTANRQPVMLTDPWSIYAEPFRTLRTNLDLINRERGAKTMMFGSAGDREGKSTTLANLAAGLARSGRSVAVVDFDLRRPTQHRLFGVASTPGLSDVVLGNVTLGEALQTVAFPNSEGSDGQPGNGRAPVKGVVHVLAAGPSMVDYELIGDGPVGRILQELRARFDCVLVDTPPLLYVGDGLALSPQIDAMILVVRLNRVRRQSLTELTQALSASPAKPLGIVATGVVGVEHRYYYGAEGRYGRRRPEASRVGTEANQ
jgi:polysaccharide biosynthesis transport protein